MFREGNVQQEQLILPRRITVRDPSGGRYVIEGLLGKGESGAVYLVRDRRDRQHLFALKEAINPDKRDIKPANIIVPIGADKAMLVDFGSAKEYVAGGPTTVIRHSSPGYAALEQYGGGTTPRTDIYGLGATFYTLLTGTVPIDAITRVTRRRSSGTDRLKSAHPLAPRARMSVIHSCQPALCLSRHGHFETVEQLLQGL